MDDIESLKLKQTLGETHNKLLHQFVALTLLLVQPYHLVEVAMLIHLEHYASVILSFEPVERLLQVLVVALVLNAILNAIDSYAFLQ